MEQSDHRRTLAMSDPATDGAPTGEGNASQGDVRAPAGIVPRRRAALPPYRDGAGSGLDFDAGMYGLRLFSLGTLVGLVIGISLGAVVTAFFGEALSLRLRRL